jgi:hypothetical protein
MPLRIPRWLVQSAFGVLLVGSATLVFSAAPAWQQAPAADGSCPAGYLAKNGTCEDINECAVNNGGCDIQSTCTNTPGSRTCGACPANTGGSGYQGCFDVNDCPNGDCSQQDKLAPIIVTSGDITATASSSGGAAVTFSAAAIDGVDGARTVRCSPESGSTFPVGETRVTCSAADKTGNRRSVSFKVTVKPAAF